MVITRFAPSPTGMLHIGGARTALFSYFFARQNGGKCLLRIEDTDSSRNSEESIQAIFDGLKWLEIDMDGEPVFQSKNKTRHVEVAKQLLEKGHAYESFEKADGTKSDHPAIRLKVPMGKTIVKDLIHGEVTFNNQEIEDVVLLRSNGEPTYMLSVVVDDHDMNITHVIRGDDHLSNTPKQILIYEAMGWKVPEFAHIPLIHDLEGKKLSKRKNAVAVSDYRNSGYLPQAMVLYFMQLGWNPKTEKEILSKEEIIKLFNIADCGMSPSRFDFAKLEHINLQIIQGLSDVEILDLCKPEIEKIISRELCNEDINILYKIAPEAKKQSNLKKVSELLSLFIPQEKITYSNDIETFLTSNSDKVQKIKSWLPNANFTSFADSFKEFIKEMGWKFGEAGPLLRAILINKRDSVSIGLIVEALGKDEVLRRASNC